MTETQPAESLNVTSVTTVVVQGDKELMRVSGTLPLPVGAEIRLPNPERRFTVSTVRFVVRDDLKAYVVLEAKVASRGA